MSARQFVISNGALEVRLLTLGATVQEVLLAGLPYSLTLGTGELAAYGRGMEYFGALVGPVANRIAGGSAPLGMKRLQFDRNERGVTTLHSGRTGTHAKLWEAVSAGAHYVTFKLSLPDGEGGFPGNREVLATYSIELPATLRLEVTATTDAETFMNFANHSYWCLDGSGSILGHKLTVPADRYVPVDRTGIPDGQAHPVEGTDFDLRAGHTFTQGGPNFDHNFCLSDQRSQMHHACTLEAPNGVTMVMETTEAGLQVYDGARIDSAPWTGPDGAPYGPYAGVALEAQGWPDAPNRPAFPRINLQAGQKYQQETHWRFSRG